MSLARISTPLTHRPGSLPGAWAAHLLQLSKRVSGASIIAFGLLLAACGGGGGGGSGGGGGGGGATYALSGTVTGATSVSVALSGAATATSTTDSNGVYSFTGLSNGSFTVTPTKAGYTFNPVSLTTTVTNANVTAQNFTATANTATTYTLSGTVTGPWVEKVRVALSGASSGSTLTDANGTYTFANLAAGTYTVAPALPGYNYSPAAPSVTIGADATQNFVASSAISGNTLSGTISYPVGSKTGKVIVRVYDSCCLQQSSVAGTSIDLTSGSGTYAVRGLGGSSYVVTAEMDTLGTGEPNAANPAAASGTITFATSNLTQPLTLADPDPAAIAPVAPSSLRIYAESGSAFVFYSPALNASRQELATSYTVSWGTDTNASTGGGSQTFHAQGANQAVSWITGLPNTLLYFKMTASIGAATSAPTSVVGPVTIGPTTGANTVSGTVSFPGAPTGPLYVGLINGTTGALYYASIANPGVGSASYRIAGVPNGSYQHVAIIDQNGNHIIDAGDLNNTQGRHPTLVVSGDTTANLTLSGANATAAIATTFYSADGVTGNYGANGLVSGIIKRIVGVTLYSAPNTRVPFDAPLGSGNEFALSGGNAAPPTTADVYAFRVKYSDGTTEDITASPASPILGASALVTNPIVNVGTQFSRTVPRFEWGAPASPPTSYAYFLSINLVSGGQAWYYPSNGLGLPSSQTNLVFNVDGSANPSSLVGGESYFWSVTVRDPVTRNSAQLQAPIYRP